MAMLKGVVLAVIGLGCWTFAHEIPHNKDHGVDLPTKWPLNIAHRGACGVLPENTVEAYRRAIQDHADVLECDICVTKDLKFVCLHESWLNHSTDVAAKFPESRMSTHYIPEMRESITDWYTVDFTLAELKTLRVRQLNDFRDKSYDFKYPIATLDELIVEVKNAGRPVGIYPELKDSDWVNSLEIIKNSGKTFEEHLVDKLKEHGYTKETDPCFIQCFQIETMRHLQNLTKLPLVFLMWRGDINIADLDDWKDFYAIGPWKEQLVRRYPNNTLADPNNIINEAHKRGLRVHTYTFRNEYPYLAYEYGQDPYEEYEKFRRLGIDGFFTDFPLTFHNFLENVYKKASQEPQEPCPNDGNLSLPTLTSFLLMIIVLKFY